MNFCLTDRYISELCENDNFWQQRLEKETGNANYKPENMTWKKYYLHLLSNGAAFRLKVDRVPTGKVLDISYMKEDGTGIKAIISPGNNSRKKLVPGYRIVSDKKQGVVNASFLLNDPDMVKNWEL